MIAMLYEGRVRFRAMLILFVERCFLGDNRLDLKMGLFGLGFRLLMWGWRGRMMGGLWGGFEGSGCWGSKRSWRVCRIFWRVSERVGIFGLAIVGCWVRYQWWWLYHESADIKLTLCFRNHIQYNPNTKNPTIYPDSSSPSNIFQFPNPLQSVPQVPHINQTLSSYVNISKS